MLKELHVWLEELNTREAKNKQKLMRNLRVSYTIFNLFIMLSCVMYQVLELLIDILQQLTEDTLLMW